MSLATLSCFVGLGLGALACAPPAPVHSRQLASLPLPDTAAAPAASARGGAPAPPALPVSPVSAAKVPQPEPPAGMSQMADWLGNVCQLAVKQSACAVAPDFGCACCAPFDGCTPGSAVEASERVFAPSVAVAGAFTGPDEDELAITMPGCESHAENWGGLLLLRRGPSGFELARYVSSLNATACWALRRDDGRDLLLCQRGDAHQGTADERLFVWDLTLPDEQLQATEEVFSVIDNEWSGCWSERGTEVSSVLLGPPQLLRRAGRIELTLQLDARRGRVTAAYLARCRAIEAQEEPSAARALPRPRLLLGHRSERVVLRFDGSQRLLPRR